MRKITALFVRKDSIYKDLPYVDAWDIERDARKWPGGCPLVAHPPCRAWGMLSHLAKPRPDEKDLARFAVAQIRQFGGVLEHPKGSRLWADQNLPLPGNGYDEHGGFTVGVSQKWWGHRAEKQTLLYIVGVLPVELPLMPFDLAEASHVVAQSNNRKTRRKPECTKTEREHTPPAFAAWLVEVVRMAEVF